VRTEPDLVSLDPAWAALALGDDLIFPEELVRGLGERHFGFLQKPGAVLAAQDWIPVLAEFLRERSGGRCTTPVEVDLAAHEGVRLGRYWLLSYTRFRVGSESQISRPVASYLCKHCVRLERAENRTITADKSLKRWLRWRDLNLRPSGYEPD